MDERGEKSNAARAEGIYSFFFPDVPIYGY